MNTCGSTPSWKVKKQHEAKRTVNTRHEGNGLRLLRRDKAFLLIGLRSWLRI